MEQERSRREFLKAAGAGVAGLLVGSEAGSKIVGSDRNIMFSAADKVHAFSHDGEIDLNQWKGHISEYITPENETVKKYAKGVEIPDIETYDGLPVWFPSDLAFEYITDKKQFGVVDHFQKPEDYLRNSGKGDCEDYGFALASLMEAKGFPSRFFMGEMEDGTGHAATEVLIDDTVYVADVSSPRFFYERDEYFETFIWGKKTGMFGHDTELIEYDESWYEEFL